MSNALELGSDFVVGTDIWGRECEAAEKGVRFLGFWAVTSEPLMYHRQQLPLLPSIGPEISMS